MRCTASERRDPKDRTEGCEGSLLGSGAVICRYGERDASSRDAAMDGAISAVEKETFAADVEVVGLCRKLHAWRIFVLRPRRLLRGTAVVGCK